MLVLAGEKSGSHAMEVSQKVSLDAKEVDSAGVEDEGEDMDDSWGSDEGGENVEIRDWGGKRECSWKQCRSGKSENCTQFGLVKGDEDKFTIVVQSDNTRSEAGAWGSVSCT